MAETYLMTDYNAIVCDNKDNRDPREPPYVAWVREIDHVVIGDTMDEIVQALGGGLQDLFDEAREHDEVASMDPPSDGIASAALREAQSQGVPVTVHKYNKEITIHLHDLSGTKPSDFYKGAA